MIDDDVVDTIHFDDVVDANLEDESKCTNK